MIRSTCVVVGIRIGFNTHLYRGFCHVKPFVLVNHSYASAKEHFDELLSFEYPIVFFTSSGFIRSQVRLSCLSRCLNPRRVFVALPSICAFSIVLSF